LLSGTFLIFFQFVEVASKASFGGVGLLLFTAIRTIGNGTKDSKLR